MKSILLLVCTIIGVTCYSQTIDIPDKNFELALIEKGIDSDKTVNGVLLRTDAQLVTFLDVNNKQIQSLKGIEAFTSLKYLDCRNNYLTRLNLNSNLALETLFNDVNNTIQYKNSRELLSWFY
ncbi:hypothetical protein ACFO5O_07070 [Geojedonia litorea]|uniref:Leucine-rich repeat domain-containing protein n=1 Tax=Geojedonia litorea TaxID=1268269 RepID=A0ABV9N1B0_9FLAO